MPPEKTPAALGLAMKFKQEPEGDISGLMMMMMTIGMKRKNIENKGVGNRGRWRGDKRGRDVGNGERR